MIYRDHVDYGWVGRFVKHVPGKRAGATVPLRRVLARLDFSLGPRPTSMKDRGRATRKLNRFMRTGKRG
jgi:hypothetical protein